MIWRGKSAWVLLGAALVAPASAEQFLSLAEAQKVCFPSAERFDPFPLEMSKVEEKLIRRQSGTKANSSKVRAWLARRGEGLVGVLFFDQVLGKHDLIDYVVAITTEGKVGQVEILEYREKYGGQVAQPDWRRQFQGKTARDPLQLNRDIHNVSGATISCRHVTDGVRRLLATYEVVVRPRLVVPSGPAGVESNAGP